MRKDQDMAQDTLTNSFNTGPLSEEVKDFVYAAEIGDNKAVAEFLEKHSSAINKVNLLGQTALMQAARFGRTGTVKLLLERGADMNATNGYGDGKTPLELALENDHPEVVALLKQWPEVLRQQWLKETDCSRGLAQAIPAPRLLKGQRKMKP